MWRKVNLADPTNVAAVAGQRRQILVEKEKRKKCFSVQQSGIAKSGLWKKIAKKGKKI
jgi:hypothetical protein